MCGICGIINFENKIVSEDSIRKMMKLQKHRGPDDEGVFIENNIGLGFVRLSIFDLSIAGHQPMVSEDEQNVIVFNGEIFNFIEIREELKTKGYTFKTNSDTEVILASWKEWGEECLQKFNGMWAFCIYDKAKKKIFVSRDRFGIKPFYYYLTDNFFAFASEIPSLLSLLEQKPKPDYQSIFDYLVFNRTDHTENTFFSDIKKLQHGNSISIDLKNNSESKVNIINWYNLKEVVSKTEGFKNSHEYKELFKSAIELWLRSDVPVGVCLSGGLDSSSIVSMMIKEFKEQNINTFSIIYNKGDFGDESDFIKLYEVDVKNMFYSTLNEQTLAADMYDFIETQGEPVPTTSIYAQYKLMELAKQSVTVALNGQGADEQLAGYHYFYGFYFKDLLKRLKIFTLIRELFYYTSEHKSLFGIKTFIYFLLPKSLRTNLRIGANSIYDNQFVDKYKKSNLVDDNLYGSKSLKDSLLNHFEYKLEHLLKREDRNSMRFSIESRVPFLDYRLVEKTLASKSKMFIYKGITKHILRESMKGILPEKIRNRKDKTGFETPDAKWFRKNEWQNIINEIICSETFKNRNIFDIEKTKSFYNDYLNEKNSNSSQIWRIINLELWFRKFID